MKKSTHVSTSSRFPLVSAIWFSVPSYEFTWVLEFFIQLRYTPHSSVAIACSLMAFLWLSLHVPSAGGSQALCPLVSTTIFGEVVCAFKAFKAHHNTHTHTHMHDGWLNICRRSITPTLMMFEFTHWLYNSSDLAEQTSIYLIASRIIKLKFVFSLWRTCPGVFSRMQWPFFIRKESRLNGKAAATPPTRI